MTVVESRAICVVEPDAKLRVVAFAIDNGELVSVEIRRGIGESLYLTIKAHELIRMVHDVTGCAGCPRCLAI